MTRISEKTAAAVSLRRARKETVRTTTGIQHRFPKGDGHAAEELLPLVYEDLRKVAANRLARLVPGQTLQATALVHEVWLRMAGAEQRTWEDRAHFFAVAADVMRHVLVDHVRRRTRLKRGGGQIRVDLDQIDRSAATPDEKVLLIDEALERLQSTDPQRARIVVLKFFGGLTDREVAVSLGMAERTVERHWAYAKVWLLRCIRLMEKTSKDSGTA
jgi:RNA polymerase sigma factor (TIGR02999 family)